MKPCNPLEHEDNIGNEDTMKNDKKGITILSVEEVTDEMIDGMMKDKAVEKGEKHYINNIEGYEINKNHKVFLKALQITAKAKEEEGKVLAEVILNKIKEVSELKEQIKQLQENKKLLIHNFDDWLFVNNINKKEIKQLQKEKEELEKLMLKLWLTGDTTSKEFKYLMKLKQKLETKEVKE